MALLVRKGERGRPERSGCGYEHVLIKRRDRYSPLRPAPAVLGEEERSTLTTNEYAHGCADSAMSRKVVVRGASAAFGGSTKYMRAGEQLPAKQR